MTVPRLVPSLALVTFASLAGARLCMATPAAADASGSAASAPTSSVPARACASRAGASAPAGARTSKLRHIPDERDPCASSTGLAPKTDR